MNDNLRLIKNAMAVYPPLSEAMVIQVLMLGVQDIINNRDKLIEEGRASIVSPELWCDIAEDVMQVLNYKIDNDG